MYENRIMKSIKYYLKWGREDKNAVEGENLSKKTIYMYENIYHSETSLYN
jgi:hypothetical protein